MSNDTHTEVTSQSWFSRLGKAFKGIILGGVLFLATKNNTPPNIIPLNALPNRLNQD